MSLRGCARLVTVALAVGSCGALVVTPAGGAAALAPALARALPRLARAPPAFAAEKTGGGKRAKARAMLAKLRDAGPLRRRPAAPPPAWMGRYGPVLVRLRPLVPVLLLLILIVRMGLRRSAGVPSRKPVEVPFSAFMAYAAQGARGSPVSDLRLSLTKYSFLLDGAPAYTRPVRAPQDLVWFLHKSGLPFRAAATSGAAAFAPLIFPCIWLGAVWSILRKQMGGATGSVGKKASASLRLSADDLSFDDVAGVDIAKDEVQEIVTMLKSPEVFAAAGARLPSGVLMVGPPGTGKTLLARVMAAQAGVPFFYCSGSDFVELFVGRGAARMRALFKEAEAVAPCFIFVDELDALGKQRSLRIAGSNDEVEQTLNQMLACMDGLETSNNGVVVMGATNRYEILDPALTRPGRFDRLVRVELPDEDGRLAILKVHTRRLQLGSDVELREVAAAANLYSGAELAALANEAAIRAVRRSSVLLNQQDFLSAVASFSSSRNKLPGMPNVEKLIDGVRAGVGWPAGGKPGSKGAQTP